MAWKKGFLRIWIVVSVIWMLIVYAGERPDRHLGEYMRFNRASAIMEERLADTDGNEIYIPTKDVTYPRAKVDADLAKVELRKAQIWKKTKNSIGRFVVKTLMVSFTLLAIGSVISWIAQGFVGRRKGVENEKD